MRHAYGEELLILMEKAPLGDLKGWPIRTPLSYLEKMMALQQVSGALSSLHEAGIAHRCIEMSQVFVRTRYPAIDVVLANFSYAYDATTNESPVQRTMAEPGLHRRFPGPPAHQPQIPGSDREDESTYAATDIYQLGLLALDMFYDRPPNIVDTWWAAPHDYILAFLSARENSLSIILRNALLATNPEERVSAKQCWVMFTHMLEELQPRVPNLVSQNPEAAPDAWPEEYHPTRGWSHESRRLINRRIPASSGVSAGDD